MAVRVPLSRGKFALVSDEDGPRVLQFKWSYDGNGYACRKVRTTRRDGTPFQRKILLHRFVLDAPQGMDVDHVNRNRLDNRRCNLRLATRGQNAANMPPRRGALKGVYRRSDCNRWRAEIVVDGRKRHLGTFLSALDAAVTYDQAALEAWGEFAWLNYPELFAR